MTQNKHDGHNKKRRKSTRCFFPRTFAIVDHVLSFLIPGKMRGRIHTLDELYDHVLPFINIRLVDRTFNAVIEKKRGVFAPFATSFVPDLPFHTLRAVDVCTRIHLLDRLCDLNLSLKHGMHCLRQLCQVTKSFKGLLERFVEDLSCLPARNCHNVVQLLIESIEEVPDESIVKCVRFVHMNYEFPKLPIHIHNKDDLALSDCVPWLFIFLWSGKIRNFDRSLKLTMHRVHRANCHHDRSERF